ncbi:hypothetical protein MKW98_008050, partial [Papaver atlanticum]
SHQKFTSQISPRGITAIMKTSKETVKKKLVRELAIKMKNKQKTQQSPTDISI